MAIWALKKYSNFLQVFDEMQNLYSFLICDLRQKYEYYNFLMTRMNSIFKYYFIMVIFKINYCLNT